MYKEHKRIISICFIVLFGLGYVFKIDYRNIANAGITVISIALAVYITSFSALATSELAKKMRETTDKILSTKTQLGVITYYFKVSVAIGLSNIAVSCICLMFDTDIKVPVGLSCIGIATLGVSLLLIWIIFMFMVNRQLRND